jgi:hypothetical protein
MTTSENEAALPAPQPRCPAYSPFFALPFFQNGRLTTSAGIRSPRTSTSNLVPTFAAAAGRYVVPIAAPSEGLMVPLRT